MLQVAGRVNSEGVVLLYLGGEQSLVILREVGAGWEHVLEVGRIT